MTAKSKPAVKAVALTASDATVYPAFRSLYVGGAGNVALVLAEDTAAVTFVAVPAGTVLPFSFTKLMATNTTATDIVGLY